MDSIEIFLFCSFTLFVFYILLPFIQPSILKVAIYVINLPLIFFLSLGSLLFVTYKQDISMLQIAQMNKNMYPGWALELSFYTLGAYCFTLITLAIKPSFVSRITLPSIRFDLISPRHINRYIFLVLAIVMVLCLPHWFSIGINKTGLYSILTLSPQSYLSSREASIKLTDSALTLAFYSYGVLISNFLYPILLWRLCSSITHFSRSIYGAVLLLLVLVTNIQGARAGFFQPITIGFLTLFFCDIHSIRSNMVDSLAALVTRGNLHFSLLKKLVFVFLLCSIFLVLVTSLSVLVSTSVYDKWLIQRMLESIIHRVLSVQFYTGPINIFLVDSLQIGFENFFGGFPGASLILGDNPGIFQLTGEYSEYYFNNLIGDTNNLNTSGLFLNAAFWGPLGFAVYTFNIIVNLLVFSILSRKSFAASSTSSRYTSFPSLLSFNALVVLSMLAWEMPSSVITVFPVMWILAWLLARLYCFALRLRLR